VDGEAETIWGLRRLLIQCIGDVPGADAVPVARRFERAWSGVTIHQLLELWRVDDEVGAGPMPPEMMEVRADIGASPV
jgi:hypothetical protein